MNKNYVYGAIAITFIVAVLALFGVGYKKTVVVQTGGAVGTPTTNLPSIGVTTLSLGTGCDNTYSTCLGSNLTSVGQAIVSSSTPCALLSPTSTSTLLMFDFQVTLGTSTSITYSLATSTTGYSTTTLIATLGRGGSESWNYIPGNNVGLIKPSTYVTLGAAGFKPTDGWLVTGYCKALFVN